MIHELYADRKLTDEELTKIKEVLGAYKVIKNTITHVYAFFEKEKKS